MTSAHFVRSCWQISWRATVLGALLLWLAPTQSQQMPPARASTPGSQAQTPAPLPAAEEELLVEGDENNQVVGVFLSPDRRRVAWTIWRKKQKEGSVVVDGQSGPAFKDLRTFLFNDYIFQRDPGLVFSPDSQHFAYPAKTSDNRWVMLVDHKPGPSFNDVAILRKSSWGAPSYQRSPYPVFSPDSRHFAYPALTAEKKLVMVVDQQPGAPFDGLSEPVFSADSQHLTYTGMREKKAITMLDGKEFGAASEDVGPLVFSPDGRHLAYSASRGNKRAMTVDEKEQGPQSDQVSKPVFSPDSQHVAYTVCLAGREFLLLDGKESGPALQCDTRVYGYANNSPSPGFSPDSQHFAYIGRTAPKKQVVVLDGKPGPEWQELVEGPPMIAGLPAFVLPAFSPDSQHLAYLVVNGGSVGVVLDGKEKSLAGRGSAWEPSPSFYSGGIVPIPRVQVAPESVGINHGENLTFSPDSRRLSVVLTDHPNPSLWKATRYVVVDGAIRGEFPGTNLTVRPFFSPDSKHLAFSVTKWVSFWGRTVAFVVVDGQAGKEYTDVMADSLYFPTPNSLSYIARDKEKWYRVKQPLR